MVEDADPSGRSALPNILVYIEIRGGCPTPPALFALSEARRIARLAGASTFAIVATSALTTGELEALSRPLAQAGADKLLLCESDDFAGPPTDAAHGRALDAAAARVPPLMVLFPAGAAAATLGPPLAARLGGPFAPWCDFVMTEAEIPVPATSGRVQLVRMCPDGTSRRRLDPMEIERPIVATLGAGRRPPGTGTVVDLEIEVIACREATGGTRPVEKERSPSPYPAWELASVLVLIGDTADGKPFADVSAAALNAVAPPGTIVARAADVPDWLLASCCPDILLKIGSSPAMTARSPRTRVVLAAVAGTVDSAPENVDLMWQLASPADLNAAALGKLIADIGDTA